MQKRVAITPDSLLIPFPTQLKPTMKTQLPTLAAFVIAFAGLTGNNQAQEAPKPVSEAKPVKIVMETSKGSIELELDPVKAPISVANFVSYVKKGHYDGTIFHRCIPGFMIQGGGFTADMQQKPTDAPIKNEAQNGLKNVRGAICMARTGIVDSATSQFFINVKDNDFLNFTSPDQRGFGYAVFGKVTKGMDVVDAIVGSPTTSKGPYENVPVETISITSAKIAE
jgi:cyclophilin family peptidyl-prolyl cis-trans isomerase